MQHFTDLDDDCLLNVFSFLAPLPDLISLSKACRVSTTVSPSAHFFFYLLYVVVRFAAVRLRYSGHKFIETSHVGPPILKSNWCLRSLAHESCTNFAEVPQPDRRWAHAPAGAGARQSGWACQPTGDQGCSQRPQLQTGF